MLTIIIALVAGVLLGTFTGLFPGIHINLVSAFLLTAISFGYFSGLSPIVLVVFVVAMAITHTFIDFIPSIFLGAPEEDTFLSVLPGHKMLKEGKGYEAVVLTLYGSLIALPIILIFSLIFIYFLDDVFGFIQTIIPYILLLASFYLIFREEEFLISLTVFLLSGFLGFLTFQLPVKEPLLPLLTGLFGVSGLVVSVKDRISIPKQEISKVREIKLDKKLFLKTSFAAFVVAPMCSFLPGIGSGHAAVFGSEIMGEKYKDHRAFLFLVGALNTIVMGLSFVTAYAIGKTRTGATAAVQEILTEISSRDLFIIILVIFAASFVSFFIGVYLAKFFARYVNKFNYGKLSLVITGILIIVNLVLSNWIGLIVLITGTALGIFCVTSNVRRINLMGCLLIPSIVFYLTA